MITIVNTLADNTCGEQLKEMLSGKDSEIELVNTADMQISHCVGCNHCLLKTPGVCSIQDDYEQILRRLAKSDNLWLISDTRFGFLNYKGKNVMDRILPMLNMGLCFRDGEMRHTLRYGALNVGLVFAGNGDEELLDFWCRRAAANLGGQSLGAYSINEIEEIRVCV